MTHTQSEIPLAWVDDFIARVRPYVWVRETDHLLIKRPNQAQKLNPQGARILKALLAGASIRDVTARIGDDIGRLRDIEMFLSDVSLFLGGTLNEQHHSAATSVTPFALGFSSLPILSEIALTYRCNLRCRFCYAGCGCTQGPAGATREMAKAEVQEAVRRIWTDGEVPSLSFTGGEPLLRRDLFELIAYAKSLGFWVNLVTNGALIDETAAASLRDAGLDAAQVSLEGVRAQTHDALTQVAGSFAKTLAGIRNLRQAGVHVHTNTTINRMNLDDCARWPEFVCDELDLPRFSMNLVIPTGSAVDGSDINVRYQDVGAIVQNLAQRSERLGVELMWYSPTPMCIFNPIAHGLGNRGCAACDGLISVAPNGDVLPCASFAEPVGNLLTSGLRDIWQSDRARSLRDKSFAHPDCRSCPDFAICHGGCPLYWRHFGFGELLAHASFARERVRKSEGCNAACAS